MKYILLLTIVLLCGCEKKVETQAVTPPDQPDHTNTTFKITKREPTADDPRKFHIELPEKEFYLRMDRANPPVTWALEESRPPGATNQDQEERHLRIALKGPGLRDALLTEMSMTNYVYPVGFSSEEQLRNWHGVRQFQYEAAFGKDWRTNVPPNSWLINWTNRH